MIDYGIVYIVGVVTAFVVVFMNIRTQHKCSVCGRRFEFRKENVYRAYVHATITSGKHVFDVIDCPHCGCQHMLKERIETIEGVNEE